MRRDEYLKKSDVERVLEELKNKYKNKNDLLAEIVVCTCLYKCLAIPAEITVEPIAVQFNMMYK